MKGHMVDKLEKETWRSTESRCVCEQECTCVTSERLSYVN